MRRRCACPYGSCNRYVYLALLTGRDRHFEGPSGSTVTLVAELVPAWTSPAPVKPEPWTVTRVPPAGGPDAGLIPLIAGVSHVGQLAGCSGHGCPASRRHSDRHVAPAGRDSHVEEVG